MPVPLCTLTDKTTVGPRTIEELLTWKAVLLAELEAIEKMIVEALKTERLVAATAALASAWLLSNANHIRALADYCSDVLT
jgi:hypothetical protein